MRKARILTTLLLMASLVGLGTTRIIGTSARTVDVGTELDMRLQTPLSSKTSKVEDPFEATTLIDLTKDGVTLIPAGSLIKGIVSGVEDAGRLDRKGRLSLKFDQIKVNSRTYPLRATVTKTIESEGVEGEIGKIGAGAGLGGLIGGIIGGAKGAITGILIGAGGVIAATEGEDVDLPVASVVRIRIDSPLDLGS
jgi:hypothetical protein